MSKISFFKQFKLCPRYMVGYYHITSGRASTALQNYSNYYLCMGQTSKYVFWSEDQSENEMCQWRFGASDVSILLTLYLLNDNLDAWTFLKSYSHRLVHATDTTKSVMEYGDSIMLYNRWELSL